MTEVLIEELLHRRRRSTRATRSEVLRWPISLSRKAGKMAIEWCYLALCLPRELILGFSTRGSWRIQERLLAVCVPTRGHSGWSREDEKGAARGGQTQVRLLSCASGAIDISPSHSESAPIDVDGAFGLKEPGLPDLVSEASNGIKTSCRCEIVRQEQSHADGDRKTQSSPKV